SLLSEYEVRFSADGLGYIFSKIHSKISWKGYPTVNSVRDPILTYLQDPDARTRLEALIALGYLPPDETIGKALVEIYPEQKDPWLESAALGVASAEPLLFVEAAFHAREPAFLAPFVSQVVRLLANRQDAAQAAKLVALLAKQPANTDGLKQVALESLAATLKPGVVPAWSSDIQSAFKSLLASSHPGLSGAALPLAARWDGAGALGAELKPVISQLGAKLRDASLPDDQRGQVAANLVGVRALDASIVPNVSGLLGSSASPELQKRVIEALGSTGDAPVGSELI